MPGEAEGSRTSARSLADLRARVDDDPYRRDRVDTIKRALADAVTLARIRQARGATQEDLAAVIGVSQENISRIERQRDLYVSTLRTYARALGGELEIAFLFPEGRVVLSGDVTATPTSSGEGMPGRAMAR